MPTFPSNSTTCGTFRRPHGSCRGEAKNRLPSSRLESQLSDSTNARASRRPKLVSHGRAPKIFLVRSLNLNQLFFFSNPKNPQRFQAWRHSRLRFISYLGFLWWHLWLSHPPRVRVNTCVQCVHLTNPRTKRKVPSLTKPKGKIYKTKSLRNYITNIGKGKLNSIQFYSLWPCVTSYWWLKFSVSSKKFYLTTLLFKYFWNIPLK